MRHRLRLAEERRFRVGSRRKSGFRRARKVVVLTEDSTISSRTNAASRPRILLMGNRLPPRDNGNPRVSGAVRTTNGDFAWRPPGWNRRRCQCRFFLYAAEHRRYGVQAAGRSLRLTGAWFGRNHETPTRMYSPVSVSSLLTATRCSRFHGRHETVCPRRQGSAA